MGKQLGVIQFRGKLGQTVGRKKSRASKGNTIAVYQPNVSNPRTLAQRMQRVKLAAANNFYRALNVILNHSYQGVPYGGASRSFFMKYALRQKMGFPYLVKGDIRPVPGRYLISNGSLTPVDVTFGQDGQRVPYVSARFLEKIGTCTRIGEASLAILSKSVNLKNGDQLTFIVCVCDDAVEAETTFEWKYFRFVIDTQSDVLLADWATSQGVCLDAIDFKNDILIGPDMDALAGYTAVAAACIVSRPPLSIGGSWQRSQTYLQVRGLLEAQFSSSEAINAALDSYGNNVADVTSDWYLNQGTGESDGSSNGSTQSRAIIESYFNLGGESLPLAAMKVGSNIYLIVGDDVTNGEREIYEFVSSDFIKKRALAQVADLDGIPIRKLSTVLTYFPDLYVTYGGTIPEDQP